jgi:predicted dehydrogenase
MKVLIIGLGSIARKHIAALREIDPGVELFAMRSSRASKEVEGVIDLYELDKVRKLDIDFIIISNPTFKHKETIGNLIDLDRPLFIEKPLFDKLVGYALLKLIAEKKITTYVACNLRFLDCLRFCRKFVAGKRINEVNIYCGSYLPEWRPGLNFREVYSANKEMGGGVHIDLIHELDYAYWLFGKPAFVKRNTSSVSSLKIDSIDYANYLLGYDHYNISVILNYYRRDAKRTLEVVCEDGSLNVDLLKNEVAWNGKMIFDTKQDISDTYKEQMKFFTENILRGECSFNTVDEAYEILKICLAKE